MSSSFHKLFPRHISRVRAAIGEENFVLYDQAVQKIVPKIHWVKDTRSNYVFGMDLGGGDGEDG